MPKKLCIIFLFSLIAFQTATASNHEYHRLVTKISRLQHFKVEHDGFLGSVSVGRVQQILSPTTFRLTNGIKIRMLGIEDPLVHGESGLHKCFASSMQTYLSGRLVGRKVILRRDRTDFDQARYLLRYVYLPGWRKHEKEVFFTRQMIEDGYAKPFFEGKNLQWQRNFEKTVLKGYRQTHSPWYGCTSHLSN